MMKKTIWAIAIGISLISCNMNQASQDVDKSQLNFVKLEIQVEGMTCEGCENTVQTELLKLDGVGMVKASHIQKMVTVEVDTLVSPLGEVKSNIERVGYTVLK